MNKKPPRDSEFGFRHVVVPLLVVFFLIPPSCGAAIALTTDMSFMSGFYMGVAVLTLGLGFAFSRGLDRIR